MIRSRYLLWAAVAAALTGAGCQRAAVGTVSAPALAGGSPPAKVAEPTRPIAAQTVELKFVELTERTSWCYYGLHDGKISYSFPNAVGRLTIEVRDGKVYADTNGDGTIDAKDAAPVEPGKATLKFAMGLPGGRTVELPVAIGELRKFDNGDSTTFLKLSPQGAMEATAGDWTFRYGAQGFAASPLEVFGDVRITPAGSSAGRSYSQSRTYEIAGRLYQVELADDLTQLTITPYTGEVAEVRFSYVLPEDAAPVDKSWQDSPDNSSISLRHAGGVQSSQMNVRETARFVPGDYHLASLFLTRQIKSGQAYISGRMSDRTRTLQLKPGKNEIQFGAPFKIDCVAARDGQKVELSNVMVTGRLGESYSAPGQGGESLFASYVRAGGREMELAKLSYG